MYYRSGARAPEERCPCRLIAAPQLSQKYQTCPGLGGTRCRLPSLGPPSSPLRKTRQALSVRGEQLEELILRSVLNGHAQNCWGKEGVRGYVPLLGAVLSGRALAVLRPSAINPESSRPACGTGRVRASAGEPETLGQGDSEHKAPQNGELPGFSTTEGCLTAFYTPENPPRQQFDQGDGESLGFNPTED